jgi:hypothetical protein
MRLANFFPLDSQSGQFVLLVSDGPSRSSLEQFEQVTHLGNTMTGNPSESFSSLTPIAGGWTK